MQSRFFTGLAAGFGNMTYGELPQNWTQKLDGWKSESLERDTQLSILSMTLAIVFGLNGLFVD